MGAASLIEVNAVFRCKRCKAEIHSEFDRSALDFTEAKPTNNRLLVYGENISTIIHQCREGEYGILDLIGYNWKEEE